MIATEKSQAVCHCSVSLGLVVQESRVMKSRSRRKVVFQVFAFCLLVCSGHVHIKSESSTLTLSPVSSRTTITGMAAGAPLAGLIKSRSPGFPLQWQWDRLSWNVRINNVYQFAARVIKHMIRSNLGRER